jgi:hypothetical protein
MFDLTWRELFICAGLGLLCALGLFAMIELSPSHGKPSDCIIIGGTFNFGGC